MGTNFLVAFHLFEVTRSSAKVTRGFLCRSTDRNVEVRAVPPDPNEPMDTRSTPPSSATSPSSALPAVEPVSEARTPGFELGRTFAALVTERLPGDRVRLATANGPIEVTTRVPLVVGRSYLFERLTDDGLRWRVLAVLDGHVARLPRAAAVDVDALVRAFVVDEAGRRTGDAPPASADAWASLLLRTVDLALDSWLRSWLALRGGGTAFDRALRAAWDGAAEEPDAEQPHRTTTGTETGERGRAADPRDGASARRLPDGVPWRFELPFLDGEHENRADLYVFADREEARTGGRAVRTKRVLLHLSLRATGPLQIDVHAPADDELAVNLVADPAWCDRFRRAVPRLRAALQEAGFPAPRIEVAGSAPLLDPSADGRLLDVLL